MENSQEIQGKWWPYDPARYEHAKLELMATGKFIDPHLAMMWTFKSGIYYSKGSSYVFADILSNSNFSEECIGAFKRELIRRRKIWEDRNKLKSKKRYVSGTFVERVMAARRVEAHANSYLTRHLKGYRVHIIPACPSGSPFTATSGYNLVGPDHNGIKTIYVVQDQSSDLIFKVRMENDKQIDIGTGLEGWGLYVYGLPMQVPQFTHSEAAYWLTEYKEIVKNHVQGRLATRST